ncbi:hypothetical protein EV175_007502, partial [Coemansia sp. RSA 1933]
MYPENPLESPLTPGSAAAAASSSDSRWLAARQSKFDEIDAKARIIDASAHPPQAQDRMVPGVSVVGRGRPSNRNAMAISPPMNGTAECDAGAEKTGIEYFDPNATTCTAKELWALIEQSRTGIGGHPMVLILDIRPHQDYV